MTTIADRVRQGRIDAGLSQTALAGGAFSPSYISLIEAGRREPTDAALAVLAARMGSTVEFLKFGADGPNEARTRLEVDFAKLDVRSGAAASARERISRLDLDRVTHALKVEALLTLARAHEGLGDLESAVAILEPLLVDAQARGHHLDAAGVATGLVASYLEAGDLHRSIEVGERVVADLEKAGLSGTDEHLRLASTLLWAYVERGDLLYATHRASELVRQADEQGTPRGRGSVYWNAALVAEQRRDYDLAQRYTERALALLDGGEVSRDVPRLRLNYAWLLLRSEPAEPIEARDLDEWVDAARANARVHVRVVDDQGKVVHEERAKSFVSPKRRTAVVRRDGRCRWPGCEHRLRLQVHHLHPSSWGGPHDISNLAAVCPYHHGLLIPHGDHVLAGNPNQPDGLTLVDAADRAPP